MRSVAKRGDAVLHAVLLLTLSLCTGIAPAQERPAQERPPAAPPSQERPPAGQAAPAAAEKKTPPPEEKSSRTTRTVRIGGVDIKYTATAGTLLLKKEDGTPRASIFYIAYTRDDGGDPTRRPVTFTFNGGPGSSSVWLHLGAFGPRRVSMGDVGSLAAPPYRMVDNENSILDVTDLVFIDPVTTGYSRAVPSDAAKQFHGIQEDLESVGEFIRLWTTRSERWGSPKFLAGESYGTTRAAGLSGLLQQRHGMFLNGIVLVSSILNFQTARFDVGNDLPFALFLPTYTATAWYHKKLPADLQASLPKALDEARRFAVTDYTLALAEGDRLTGQQRTQIVQKLARLTGLSPAYIEETNLRINIVRFCKELLRSERRTVGRLDSRFQGIDLDAAGERNEYDPSNAAILGPYSTLLNDYVRRELKFESDLPYEILTGRVQPWNYEPYENRYVNVAETLRSAMTQNQNLQVYVANGYYDLATPFFATEYTLNHLQLDPALRDHISMGYYEAGHMMYIHAPSHTKLRQDVTGFLRASSPK